MGRHWLHDLPTVLRSAGLDVIVRQGAATKSRSTGGLQEILGLVNHHTAGGTNEVGGENYSYDNASDRPIGNYHTRRNGVVVIGAMGAANTQGKGGPLKVSKGTIPLNQGNIYMIANEIHNNGVGEPFPKVQVDSVLTADAAICKHYGLAPLSDIHTHFSYVRPSCPGRKIDPRGIATGRPAIADQRLDIWNEVELRKAVAAISAPKPPPPVRHTVRSVPDGMEDDPTRVGDPVWDGSNANNTRWLQTFFVEQGWWNGTPNGYWTAEFQSRVAFVQRAFRTIQYPTSPRHLTRFDGVWWQETAAKIDAWARLQDWY